MLYQLSPGGALTMFSLICVFSGIEEAGDGRNDAWIGKDVVVRGARNDREPVLVHPGAIPAGVLLAAAEELEERRDMRGSNGIPVAVDQHRRHRQAGDRGGPVEFL